jgi:hypothetical protein
MGYQVIGKEPLAYIFESESTSEIITMQKKVFLCFVLLQGKDKPPPAFFWK